ncbi:MAG: sigma-70 family RNA polymerase sigma factor [Sedimentisphaerales bacterium]|nr:sigma-70 family RNA polymerase sigma factor [Sedimentisphaerales bacterium]
MMLQEKLLLWKLRRGDAEAVRQVYEKHKHDMLGLAVALSGERATGEDVVHDVFVSFVRFCPKLQLRTSLRSYLLSSVANRARNLNRARSQRVLSTDEIGEETSDLGRPDRIAVQAEQARLVEQAMAQLPYDQREAIILHLQVAMTFKEIAASQDVSINTVQSRYRYGLQKLRSLLDDTVTP